MQGDEVGPAQKVIEGDLCDFQVGMNIDDIENKDIHSEGDGFFRHVKSDPAAADYSQSFSGKFRSPEQLFFPFVLFHRKIGFA